MLRPAYEATEWPDHRSRTNVTTASPGLPAIEGQGGFIEDAVQAALERHPTVAQDIRRLLSVKFCDGTDERP